MAQVLLYYEIDEPSTSLDLGPGDAEVAELLVRGKQPIVSQNKKSKNRLKYQMMVVRLRTRLCKLPRVEPVLVPIDVWKEMLQLTNVEPDDEFRSTKPIDSRLGILEHAPHSPLWGAIPTKATDRAQYNSAEWEAGTQLHQLCLLPHCDYSYRLDEETAEGKHLLEEQRQIMA